MSALSQVHAKLKKLHPDVNAKLHVQLADARTGICEVSRNAILKVFNWLNQEQLRNTVKKNRNMTPFLSFPFLSFPFLSFSSSSSSFLLGFQVARELDSEAVVVGSHGKGLIARAVLGSTPAYLASHIDRSLVIVR
mgnify:CR=1 FL=1